MGFALAELLYAGGYYCKNYPYCYQNSVFYGLRLYLKALAEAA